MAEIDTLVGSLEMRPAQDSNGVAAVAHSHGDPTWQMTPAQLRRLASAARALANELEDQ